MKPIYFEIPFNGVKVSKAKFIIPKYTLPAKDWLFHNQIDIDDKNIEIFTFIRNPLERVILQYKHQLKYRSALRQYPMPFKEWCISSFNNSNVDKFMQNNPKEFLSQTAWIKGLNKVIKLYPCEQLFFLNDFFDNSSRLTVKNYYKSDFKKFSNVYF